MDIDKLSPKMIIAWFVFAKRNYLAQPIPNSNPEFIRSRI
jgi:hypothetical protein